MSLRSNHKQINGNMLKEEISYMLSQYDDVDAAVIVSSDGHTIEKIEKVRYPLKRLGTMGSALMSLGDSITRELKMGHCKNIITENENGILIYMHINTDIVLVTLSKNTKSLGMLLRATRFCCKNVQKRLNPTVL